MHAYVRACVCVYYGVGEWVYVFMFCSWVRNLLIRKLKVDIEAPRNESDENDYYDDYDCIYTVYFTMTVRIYTNGLVTFENNTKH